MDQVPVSYAELEYYMLNKPQGVVSATEDNVHETVMDLLRKGPDGPKRKDLFPVGRLDIDTEGPLLITNDGELAHGLLSPRRHVDKRYYAKVEGELPQTPAGGLNRESPSWTARLRFPRSWSFWTAAKRREAGRTAAKGPEAERPGRTSAGWRSPSMKGSFIR